MSNITVSGIDSAELKRVLEAGVDHGGNSIEPFADKDGGMPMRCCLADSRAGDNVAIIAWSPFSWHGPYKEVGPIYVHTDPCPSADALDELPEDFDSRAMVLRPYGFNKMIAYHRVRHVPAGESLTAHAKELLAMDDVDFLHGRNVTGGCFSFAASSKTKSSKTK